MRKTVNTSESSDPGHGQRRGQVFGMCGVVVFHCTSPDGPPPPGLPDAARGKILGAHTAISCLFSLEY
jgi:hypothetical protein